MDIALSTSLAQWMYPSGTRHRDRHDHANMHAKSSVQTIIGKEGLTFTPFTTRNRHQNLPLCGGMQVLFLAFKHAILIGRPQYFDQDDVADQ